MNTGEYLLRIVAIILVIAVCFGGAGGQIIKHDTLPSGLIRTQTLTLYTKLPPPPRGPGFCEFLHYEQYAASLPCDFKPPFIDMLKARLQSAKSASPFSSRTLPSAT